MPLSKGHQKSSGADDGVRAPVLVVQSSSAAQREAAKVAGATATAHVNGSAKDAGDPAVAVRKDQVVTSTGGENKRDLNNTRQTWSQSTAVSPKFKSGTPPAAVLPVSTSPGKGTAQATASRASSSAVAPLAPGWSEHVCIAPRPLVHFIFQMCNNFFV